MIKAYFYQPGSTLRIESDTERFAELLSLEKGFLWVDIDSPEDEDVELLLNTFGLHTLTVEDCILPNARPKIEQFPNYLFLALFAIERNHSNKIEAMELDFCLGSNFLITVHTETIKSLNSIKERIEKASPIITKGSDFLLYSIVDSLIDSYFPVIDELDDRVEKLQDAIFKGAPEQVIKDILMLKNEAMFLRRTVGPQRDLITLLNKGDFPLIRPSNYVYFRDIYDHLVRINDLVDSCREVISGALEVSVFVVANRTNEIVKTLTILATIMMPPVIIASIYGMNFKFMPELNKWWGYPLSLGLMAFLSLGIWIFLKRKRWA